MWTARLSHALQARGGADGAGCSASCGRRTRCPAAGARRERRVRTAWSTVGSDRAHAGGARALGALLDVVLDLRALSQRLKAAAGDRGMMYEHVLALIVGR